MNHLVVCALILIVWVAAMVWLRWEQRDLDRFIEKMNRDNEEYDRQWKEAWRRFGRGEMRR